MAIWGKSGVTGKTPGNILFGAGTIHKGLKYTKGADDQPGSWNLMESLVGATNGGSKFSITPEIFNIEVDGVGVKSKGMAQKTGETATMEINLAELTEDIILASTFGEKVSSDVTGYDKIQPKPEIAEGDYWDNIAFAGKTTTGELVYAIMENALCTSGLEHEGKNKDGSVGKYTFECYAEFDENTDKDILPWTIYYPTREKTVAGQKAAAQGAAVQKAN